MPTFALRLVCLLLALCPGTWGHAGALDGSKCIAPAKPGGGFDITCQFTRDVLQKSGQTHTPLSIAYQPGGIGALSFKNATTQQPPDVHAVTAFSSGSLLNLAQGRFGPYTARDVRWLAVVGMDYGVVAVHRDSPHKTLVQLLDALRENTSSIIFGAGGSIGSQDWMKAALLARQANVSHKAMRFVAFEGGGEAMSALASGHVQVLAGDAAEIGRSLDGGAPIRVLAVLSPKRLAGRWAQVPTAQEQGVNLEWPILRGLYLGRHVPEREAREWSEALARAMDSNYVARELEKAGMQRYWVVGPDLENLVHTQLKLFETLALEFGVSRR